VGAVDMGANSMDMVNLLPNMEAEFDLIQLQAEITLDNFRSVQMTERIIDGQLQL
jgi:acyl carrier protein